MQRKDIPDVHVFHTHDDIVIRIQKCTVEVYNVIGVTSVHDL